MADTASSSNPWHAIFAFLIPATAMIVQMHFPNSSPLEKHPPNMWVFIVCLFLYCFALASYFKCQISTSADSPSLKLSSNVAVISGSMATAALISVLVSDSHLPLIIIVYFMLLLIYFAPNPVTRTCNYIASSVYNMCKRTESSNHDSTINIQG